MTNRPRPSPAVNLADQLLDTILDASPVHATMLGIRDRDHLLTDYTEAGEETVAARLARIAAEADRLATGGDSALDPSYRLVPGQSEPRGGSGGDGQGDRVTAAVVRQQAAAERDMLAVRAVEFTVTDWFAAPVAGLLSSLPRTSIAEPAHAEGYLARLGQIPGALAAIAQRHRNGVAAGRLPVRRLAQAAVDQLDRYLANHDSDPLARPAPPAEADRAAFEAERDKLLAELVRPAVGSYRDLLAAEVVPHGRQDDRPGLCWLPDGDAHYIRLARAHTTTDRTPAQLHQTGLDQIARLHEEYARLGERVLGTGDVPEVFHRLRTDPGLRWADATEPVGVATDAVARAEQAAPAWFGRLPSQRCTVEPVPVPEAPGAPPAYYTQPALDGSRPGTFYVNTHRVRERYRYISEATAFHEAVPGHHFQRTLAQELTELPLLRRLARVTAYVEGWGLYCERLADEMGLYSGDLARLGMLCLDSMRAGRLVVDTGLHVYGWTRQQAVEYLVANTPMSTVEIGTEVDRYIAYPGQALAYLVGRLEIERLRADAEQALGGRFDVRAFHDTVLGSGPLPLTVLAELVGRWAGRPG